MMTPHPATRLLSALYARAPAGLFAEMRALNPSRAPVRWFFPLPLDTAGTADLDARAAEVNARGYDVYFGVNPRRRAAGTAADVAGYGALVLDLDDAASADHAMGRLRDARLQPSAIVASGRGTHIYLMLDHLAPVEAARPVARALVAFAGGDPVHDPPRVLRVPGTRNYKPAAHGATATIQALDDGRRYKLGGIRDALAPFGIEPAPDVPQVVASTLRGRLVPVAPNDLLQATRARLRDITASLPAAVRARAADRLPRGRRSERDMAVVRALVTAGATDEEIEMFAALLPAAFGMKTHERGLAYLARTIQVARATSVTVCPRGIVSVRCLDARRIRSTRVVLDLATLDGPAIGVRFAQGLSFGSSRGLAVARRAVAAFGLDPDLILPLSCFVGRTARVILRTDDAGIEVAAWHP